MKKKTKKAAKKTVRKKKASPKKKRVIKKSSAKKVKKAGPRKASAVKPKVEGIFIGRISHYFPHVNAAAIKIEKRSLKVGDQLRFKGHTTDFTQTVESLQINHVSVQKVGVGDDVGIQVRERVREHDEVYKVSKLT